MMSLHGLEALNRAFAEQAAAVGADAIVQSAIWPTAGQMIDHLGNVQAWVTEIVRTGAPADRKALVRPEDEDPVEWFTQTSRRLVATLASVNPDRECWTLFEAPSITSFWGRRMTRTRRPNISGTSGRPATQRHRCRRSWNSDSRPTPSTSSWRSLCPPRVLAGSSPFRTISSWWRTTSTAAGDSRRTGTSSPP
ncbi:hypothetical protein MIC448_1640017 [Microbacterium sp. C448]|nr:hypothetical protein MIC448_1640017 [Microbacterium sp. C448]